MNMRIVCQLKIPVNNADLLGERAELSPMSKRRRRDTLAAVRGAPLARLPCGPDRV